MTNLPMIERIEGDVPRPQYSLGDYRGKVEQTYICYSPEQAENLCRHMVGKRMDELEFITLPDNDYVCTQTVSMGQDARGNWQVKATFEKQPHADQPMIVEAME